MTRRPGSSVSTGSKPLPADGEELAKGSFVGRARELPELERGLEAAISGRGKLFLVAGEPGIGKTRNSPTISSVSA